MAGRPHLRWALLAALCTALTSAAKAEPQVATVPLGFAATEFRAPDSRVAALVGTTDALRGNKAAEQPLVVVWGSGGGVALGLKDGAVVSFPLGQAGGDLAAIERGRDAIPGAHTQAAGPITVMLTGPTRAPGHAALGSDLHAGEITIVERRPVPPGPDPKPVPQVTSHVGAGAGAAFEDRAPRLIDLDGNGSPEIVTVRVDASGAHLVVIGLRPEGWAIRAETPPEGGPDAQIHPAALADFQGRGHPQIALVRASERDGVLEIWGFEQGRLTKLGEAPGYTSHAPGQPAQDLAAAADLDGDGTPELAVPTLDRTALAILSLKGGITERTRIPLPARAAVGVATLGAGKGTHLLVGLEDGRIADIRP